MISTSLKDPSDICAKQVKWIPDYHYIIEAGQKIEVDIIEEKTDVRILEDIFKDQIITVYKNNIETKPRHWWQPWEKVSKIKIDENRYEVEILSGSVKVEIIKEVNGDFERIERQLSTEEVLRGIKPVWSNYTAVLKAIPFARFYFNSFFMSVGVTVGMVITSSMAAYSFSRLEFPGRDKLFIGYIATMMVPYAVVLVPAYILMRWLRWIDTYYALIVPGMFSAYGTFMLRQFFMTLPVDLEDAAKIDGCGYVKIFWHIILPLSKAALATLTTFTFMGTWLNFMWPLIVTKSRDMATLQVGLAYFQETGFGTEYHLLMAGAVMATVPIIIIFIFNQRFFVEGIKMQGIKG